MPIFNTYAEAAEAAVNTSVWLVTITLDFCGNVFSIAPCTATGIECYNTFNNCRDPENYTREFKEYEFTSVETELPFPGPRPYVKTVKCQAAAEIKAGKTVTGRWAVTFIDEPDDDIGIDPYQSLRSSVPNTGFWKKFLARNPYYRGKGRGVKIEHGYIGLPRAEFQERFFGGIEDIVTNSDDSVTFKIVDPLRALKDIEIPPKVDNKTAGDLTLEPTEIVLTGDLSLWPSVGYARLDKNIISYTSIDLLQNELNGCVWGAAGTDISDVKANTGAGIVRKDVGNPFDLIDSYLLNDAGYDASKVDSVQIAAERDDPGGEPVLTAWLVEPMKLADLVWELVDLNDLQLWYNEGQKITLQRNMPNRPGRAFVDIDEAANIVQGSQKIDANTDARTGLVVIYWDKKILEKDGEAASYNLVAGQVDTVSTSINAHGTFDELVIFTRFISLVDMQQEVAESYLASLYARRLWFYANAPEILEFQVEVKDGGINTGEHVRISTKKLVTFDGSPLVDVPFEIIYRQPVGQLVTLRAVRQPTARILFLAPDAHPDYVDATTSDRMYGYLADDNGQMPDGSDGYSLW